MSEKRSKEHLHIKQLARRQTLWLRSRGPNLRICHVPARKCGGTVKGLFVHWRRWISPSFFQLKQELIGDQQETESDRNREIEPETSREEGKWWWTHRWWIYIRSRATHSGRRSRRWRRTPLSLIAWLAWKSSTCPLSLAEIYVPFSFIQAIEVTFDLYGNLKLLRHFESFNNHELDLFSKEMETT